MVAGDHATSPTGVMNGITGKLNKWTVVCKKTRKRVREIKVNYPPVIATKMSC